MPTTTTRTFQDQKDFVREIQELYGFASEAEANRYICELAKETLDTDVSPNETSDAGQFQSQEELPVEVIPPATSRFLRDPIVYDRLASLEAQAQANTRQHVRSLMLQPQGLPNASVREQLLEFLHELEEGGAHEFVLDDVRRMIDFEALEAATEKPAAKLALGSGS